MSCVTIQNIADTECIGASLPKINGNFAALSGAVCELYTTTNQISGSLGGFRNKLINAQGLINQRVYVSGTATTTANQYTVDRWRVVTSGQNLTFSTSQNVVTFTAPAGGVEQVVEGLSVETGTYVLNWTGTATATVNGTARTKGATFTLTGGSNVTVRFIGGTFSLPQLEKSIVPTPFEYRPFGTELALCQRYYAKSYPLDTAPGSVAGTSIAVHTAEPTTNTLHNMKWVFPVTMRTAPTVNIYSPGTGAINRIRRSNDTGVLIDEPVSSIDVDQYQVHHVVMTSPVNLSPLDRGYRFWFAHFTANAEL